MISQHEIDMVIDATDIVSLVSEYVKLEKKGKNYMGLCPFHNEDTPSFVVSPEKKLAHCFGCGGGGSPIKFIQDIEHISFNEAVAFLAKRANIAISYQSTEKKNPAFDKYYNIMGVASEFYSKYLLNSKSGLEALEYLHQRGLTDDVIKAFNIGLAPQKSDSLYQVLKESGFLELDMTELALVDKNPKGYYDIFQKRIMFPICDEQGHVVAFSGRIFNNPDKSQPKYINSRETVIFKKSSTMFNIQNAKGEILKKKRVILHEGQMDVIAAYNAGFTEAICTLGTALSDEHAKILKKYTNHAVICYDGDGAGIRASLKAIKIFKANGFTVHLVLLPNGKDPDEYVKEFGKEAYSKYFESHMLDANHYIFEQAVLNKDFSDGVVVETVKKEVFEMVYGANSNTATEEFLSKLAGIMNVSKEALIADYNIFVSKNRPTKPKEIFYPEDEYYQNGDVTNIIVKRKRIATRAEERLFMYARESKSKAIYIDQRIGDKLDAFSQENQLIWNALIYKYYDNFQTFSEHDFLMTLEPELVSHYVDMINEIKSDQTIYNDKDLNDCIMKLDEVRLDNNTKKLKEKFEASDTNYSKLKLLENMFKNKKQKDIIKKTNRRK